MWSACAASDPATTSYGVEVLEGVGYRLWSDDVIFGEGQDLSVAMRDHVRRVNADVVAAAGEFIVMHASAAVLSGKGVLFPAAMESGKTTLVAGLIRAGWSYLSDEAVGIHPDTLQLHAYPKPLSIDPGSWPVLHDLCPARPPSLPDLNSVQWQVPPLSIGRISPVADSVAVVAPNYVAGATTQIRAVAPARAVLLLAESCFTLRQRSEHTLQRLAALVRRCRCFELTMGSLDKAINTVAATLNQASHEG